MKKNMPDGIRVETLRLLTDIWTKVANGSISHKELERFAKRQNPFGVDVSAIDWHKVYGLLSMTWEYEEFLANEGPLVTKPGLWTVPMLKGVSCNKMIVAFKKLKVDVYQYVDDLDADVTKNDRDPNKTGSYAVSFTANMEADENLKNFSAIKLAKQGVKGITLLERLILELGYFLTTGKHLDEVNVTLCNGSRHSYGRVPCVSRSADDRRVYVGWYDPDDARDFLRTRAVVS